MNLKLAILPKIISKWAVFGLLPIVIVLAAIIFKVITSFFMTYEQLANQSMVSGNLEVIDSSMVIESVNSTLVPQSVNIHSGKDPEISSIKLLDSSFLFVCVGQQALLHSFNSIRKQPPVGPPGCLFDSFAAWSHSNFLADR